ncbi:MAG: diphthine synthase [Candidatus ainarchaeum sp.]|nr:diphthine synthase [Candidatus ainarchaeum sp.]
MGLTLVGAGLWDETDVSLKGLAALKKCGKAYAEQYTSERKPGSLSRLERLCGKGITRLSREEVEDGKRLISEAAAGEVALVVGGDPMVSTTHASLKLEARKAGVPFRVIHSSSILSAAVSESGLHAYKFGRPVTLPFWSEKYEPTSTYDAILENRGRGLHTLLFLDLKQGKTMTALAAFKLLSEMERKKREGLVSSATRLVVLSRVGAPDMKVAYGELEALAKNLKLLGKTPFILIVPGKLHFTEEEALSMHEVR